MTVKHMEKLAEALGTTEDFLEVVMAFRSEVARQEQVHSQKTLDVMEQWGEDIISTTKILQVIGRTFLVSP